MSNKNFLVKIFQKSPSAQEVKKNWQFPSSLNIELFLIR